MPSVAVLREGQQMTPEFFAVNAAGAVGATLHNNAQYDAWAFLCPKVLLAPAGSVLEHSCDCPLEGMW